MAIPSDTQPSAAIESIDAAAQSRAGAWLDLAVLGDLLAAGRLLDFWTADRRDRQLLEHLRRHDGSRPALTGLRTWDRPPCSGVRCA